MEERIKEENSLLSGAILPSLLRFSLPIMLSMLTAQLYTTVDSMLVGLLLNAEALAAVSNVSVVMMVFLFVSGGMELGGNLMAASSKLSSTREQLSTLFYNILFFDLAVALVMVGAGMVGFDDILRLIHTPEGLMKQAMQCGRVYLLGLPLMMLYDLSRELLIGCGNSRLPMYLTLLTSVLNLILDVPFILLWGVTGAAAATVLAQGVGCTIVLRQLKRDYLCGRFHFGLLRLSCAFDVFRLSAPNTIQQMSAPIIGMIRQSLLGLLGASAIAGFSCAGKLNNLFMMPAYGFVQSLVVFLAQNKAVGQYDRMREGLKQGRLLLLGYTALVVFLMMGFASPLMGLFTTEVAAIGFGAYQLAHEAPAFLFMGLRFSYEAELRAAQRMKWYLVSNLSSSFCTVMLSVFLVKKFGFSGFSLSSVLVAPVALCFSIVLVRALAKRKKL